MNNYLALILLINRIVVLKGSYSLMNYIDRQKTGKTGVAFGLVRSREGGRDVHILNSTLKNDEISFPFLLGGEDRNGYFECYIGENINYNEWAQFTKCIGNEMEIYYTKESRAHTRTLPIAQVKFDILFVDDEYVNEDGYFFIRKISPDTIEYTVALLEDFKTKNYKPRKIYSLKLI